MNLTIKGIPDEVGGVLKAAAERSRRSLNGEIIYRLIQSMNTGGDPEMGSRVAGTPDSVADSWAALAGRWQSGMSIEDEIASLYETRSSGRDVDLTW
jgi:hypothetical protein